MDFIERYLGFSPDNGDGSFEAMLLIVLVTIVTGIALGFFRKAEHDQATKAQLLRFLLIYPSDKSAERPVKLIHRYLCIVFPFRPPFLFTSAAVVLNSARQHNEKKC